MRRTGALLLAFFCISTRLGAADDANKVDLDRLQGKWKVIGRVFDGKPGKTGGFWVIDGHKLHYNEAKTDYAILKLDTTQKPKAFTFEQVFENETSSDKGNEWGKGIYEIDGDTARFCVATHGKERPKTFESKAGTGQVLTVLQRVKDNK